MRQLCAMFGLLGFPGLCLLLQHPHAVRAQSPVKAAPAAQAVAIISKGKGTAFAGAKAIPLRPYRAVYPGWRLVCASDSESLVIVFNDKSAVTLTPKDRPYRVPFVLTRSGRFDSVLVPAGRSQSLAGEVFSPPQEGRVWPSHLVFRWTPLPKGTPLKLILRRSPEPVGDDEPMWAKTITEDGSGSYDSSEARDVLTQVRGQSPSSKAQFTLVVSDEQSSTVVFGLLSDEEEASLQRELSESDKEDALLRHITRASAFQHFRLYSEAADEMEQALLASPENTDLRIATIWADRRSGNLAREEYHRKRLPPGTRIPGE